MDLCKTIHGSVHNTSCGSKISPLLTVYVYLCYSLVLIKFLIQLVTSYDCENIQKKILGNTEVMCNCCKVSLKNNIV